MKNANANIERGKRLKTLRKKVGLTRLAFAEQTGMSANTLKALELGDRELTSQKALLFSNLFSGLFSVSLGEDAHEASFDYLYYGKKGDNNHHEAIVQENEDVKLQNEINLLMSNPTYLVLKLQDQLMSPYYNCGDVVAGKRIVNKHQFLQYQGYICIMELGSGDLILRRMIKADNRKITACVLNTNDNQNINIVDEYDVRSISQAIWHWHLSEIVRFPVTIK